jgi:putative ABC transport system permease protein
MKSYLSLVSKYGKVHKKKKRLTVICIAISVMLVTAIFGLADMSIRAQINAYLEQQGNFHAIISDITDPIAAQIAGRSDVKVSDWVSLVEDTTYEGKELIVQGSGQELAEAMNLVVLEGTYPATEHEALLDKQALEQFQLSIGDTIEVPFENGQIRQYRITGIYGEFSGLLGSDAHGLFLTTDGMRGISSDQYAQYYYIQFKKGVNIPQAISEVKLEYGLSDDQVSTNLILLSLMGQSDDNSILGLYLTAAVLFVLVTMSGVFMIAGSFNMSVLERTQFFGLLRCLGASKRQIKRYIRLEGLQYSLKGIPIGLLAGCIIMWISALILNLLDIRFALPEMPLFQISWPGIAAGTVMGFLVVMLASGAPAKKAAQVSPQAAVTGNMKQSDNQSIRKAANAKIHVDTSMGIHHAFSYKKNLVLTAGSFALSIILLLSFTVLVDFMDYAIKPLKPYAPDISVMRNDHSPAIDRSLMEELKALPHIKQLYGRMFSSDIPAKSKDQNGTVKLISYDEPQFHWAKEMLIDGDIERAENGDGVLVSYDKSEKSNWKIGDTVTLLFSGEPYELQITGILSDIPFDTENSEWIFICSEAAFSKLTGITNYTIIDMQVEKDISAQVRSIISPEMQLLDQQQRNQEVRTAYYTMAIFVYGFVFVIALVAFINILNTVNASVSNRMGNYGVMRAVGMSITQLKKMVIAEVASYTAMGCLVGSVLGILLHKYFFSITVTSRWGANWQPPLTIMVVTVSVTILTTFIAVISPVKKIENMSIVNVVNAG